VLEVAALAAVRPLIGTPRAAKRLVNLYRLLRAGIPDVDSFVAGKQFRAMVIVLAAQVGFARVAPELLSALVARSGASLFDALEQTASSAVGDEDTVTLRAALRAICLDEFDEPKAEMNRPVAELAEWIPKVRRFSLDGALDS
jgi:hypothetical protein